MHGVSAEAKELAVIFCACALAFLAIAGAVICAVVHAITFILGG